MIKLKYRPVWLQLLYFGFITIFCSSVIMLAGTYILAAITGIEQAKILTVDMALPEYRGLGRGLLIVQFFALFFIPSVIFAWLADVRPWVYAGFRRPDKWSFLILGFFILFFAFLMVDGLSFLNRSLVNGILDEGSRNWIISAENDINSKLKNIVTMENVGDLLISILIVGALAAIGEEIFFRGILQRLITGLVGKAIWGVVITALLFSAFHGQFMGFIPRAVLGLILGLLYLYSGSLWPAIIGHFLFNSVQVLLIYFEVASPDDQQLLEGWSTFFTGLLGGVGVIVLLNMMRKQSKSPFKRWVEDDRKAGPQDQFIT